MKYFYFGLFLILFSFKCFSLEADYFTNRYPLVEGHGLPVKPGYKFFPTLPNFSDQLRTVYFMAMNINVPSVKNMAELPDVLGEMNKQMNLELLNSGEFVRGCNEKELYKSLLNQIGGAYISAIETWPFKNQNLVVYYPGNKFNRSGTVYSDTNVMACCADIMKINDVLVSTDKLNHFFVHGYNYYEISQRVPGKLSTFLDSKMDGVSIYAALDFHGANGAVKFGYFQEETLWGMYSTGVFSYADLAANYDGFRFWSELVKGKNPYFVCRDNKWKKVRDFNWENYVTDAWDEAINCNQYSDLGLTKTIGNRVREIQIASKRSVLTCPVEPEKCPPLMKRYRDVYASVLSPSCVGVEGRN